MMDILTAIQNLDLHNRWRCGEFDEQPLSPKVLGESMDKVIEWGIEKIEEEQKTKQ